MLGNRRWLLIIIGFALISSGCSKQLSREEFDSWWSKNGNDYVIIKEFKNVTYLLRLLPTANVEPTENISEQYYRLELQTKLTDGFNILHVGVSDDASLQKRYTYFLSEFKRSCKLIIDENSFECLDLIIQPTVGITPYTSFVLTFLVATDQSKKDFIFEFTDDILNHGIVKMKMKEIDKIPELEL